MYAAAAAAAAAVGGPQGPCSLVTIAASVPSSGQQFAGTRVPRPSCVVCGLCSCNMLLLCPTQLSARQLFTNEQDNASSADGGGRGGRLCKGHQGLS